MKTRSRKIVTRLIMALGILLIAASAASIVFSHTAQQNAAEGLKQDVGAILSVMPDIQTTGMPDGRQNTEMPVLELGGTDFAGLIEVPAYNAVLPLGAVWNRREVSLHPCIYTGSMYDSTLVIGGSGNPEQFDFMKWISYGDQVSVTDMTGLRYSYLVESIITTRDVSYENLTCQDADLVLFARNSYSKDYYLVLCKLK